MSRKPVSPKQLAAKRANAAHSTGPRTSEGKAASSQNACQHGFAASTFAIVRLEELEEVAHLKADLLSFYQPINTHELLRSSGSPLHSKPSLPPASMKASIPTDGRSS